MRARALLFALGLGLVAPACEPSRAGFASEDTGRLDASADSPKSFGKLDDFRLVDQDGREMTRDDLVGRPFAMAFIFTTCSGPCPMITANMLELTEALSDVDVGLVSLSVDPEYDTPAVLRSYADEVGVDTSRWRLLTGETEVVDRLIVESMYLMVGRQVPGEDVPLGMHVSHSSKLVAFDREGAIRGYYSGVTPEGLADLEARLRFLAREDR